jgi:hypothetical protein
MSRETALERAFAKLALWQESETTVKLTVVEVGEAPQTFTTKIAVVDESSRQISFVVGHKRSYRVIDLSDASFQVGDSVLAAERPTGDPFKDRNCGAWTTRAMKKSDLLHALQCATRDLSVIRCREKSFRSHPQFYSFLQIG